MPKVRLLRDVKEGRYVKQSPRREARIVGQRQPNGSVTEVVEREGRDAVHWTEGVVVEMSEASAAKYVKKGWGEIVKEKK